MKIFFLLSFCLISFLSKAQNIVNNEALKDNMLFYIKYILYEQRVVFLNETNLANFTNFLNLPTKIDTLKSQGFPKCFRFLKINIENSTGKIPSFLNCENYILLVNECGFLGIPNGKYTNGFKKIYKLNGIPFEQNDFGLLLSDLERGKSFKINAKYLVEMYQIQDFDLACFFEVFRKPKKGKRYDCVCQD